MVALPQGLPDVGPGPRRASSPQASLRPRLSGSQGTPSPVRRFIKEKPIPSPRSSSLTTVDPGRLQTRDSPVGDASNGLCSASGSQTTSSVVGSSQLFAGWEDTATFSSLLESDWARLQMRIGDARRRVGAMPPPNGVDLQRCDLAALATALATSMLGPPRIPRAGKAEEGHLRALCNQSAKRAAQLEVLLALLAELMVLASDGSCTGGSTRIGWVENVLTSLLVGGTSANIEKASSSKPSQKTVAVQAFAPTLRDGSTQVDTVPPCKTKAASSQTDVLDSSAMQACVMAPSAERHESTESQMTQTEVDPRKSDLVSQGCQTESFHAAACDAAVGTESVAVLAAAVQSVPVTEDSSMQTQVDSTDQHVQTCVLSSEAFVQTDSAPAPRPGGLRATRAAADQTERALEKARERLELEREAAVALEARLGKAERWAKELQCQNESLKAALPPPPPAMAEAETQVALEADEVEVQTDPIPFYSHSWQAKSVSPEPLPTSPDASSMSDIGVQTSALETSDSLVQTISVETADAICGEEEPLGLALGTDIWRAQYSGGMDMMVKLWREKYEESEKEVGKLKAMQKSSAT